MPQAMPSQHSDEYVLFPEAGLFRSGQARRAGEGAVEALAREKDLEGSLAVDVAETDDELIVRSAIAGVRPEDIELFVQHDMLTLRGRRLDDLEPEARKLVSECHWGSFSRSLILPTDVDRENVSAAFKDGVLTVRLPKTKRPSKKIVVEFVEQG